MGNFEFNAGEVSRSQYIIVFFMKHAILGCRFEICKGCFYDMQYGNFL